jgi:prolyl-tRNA synthetase
MKQSLLFTKTKKENPSGEVSKNAQLLIRAGFVHKEMAGVYAYLPLGIRVIEKIKQIVREEMNTIGGQELIMTAIQRKDVWQQTERWSDEAVDVWFKSKLKNGTDIGFGWSHEEPITDMMKAYLKSYKDLPAFVYQFQTKLRNELRAKSGIMRGREFVMKDMYSFTRDSEAHEAFYAKATEAYMNVFRRVGLGDDTYVTFAAGGAFTEFSHEFQTVTPAGEDSIYINREKHIAINEEVLSDKTLADLGVKRDELEKVNSAEVGNIFNFGTKKCEKLGLTIVAEDGTNVPVHLGSYGIGITRLMGVLVEHFSDESGMIWPKSVAPYQVHLISLCRDEDIVKADELYAKLTDAGIEVLYDDRKDTRAGQKFADSDLIGIPLRVVMSKKTLEQQGVEIKQRNASEAKIIKIDDLFDVIQNNK